MERSVDRQGCVFKVDSHSITPLRSVTRAMGMAMSYDPQAAPLVAVVAVPESQQDAQVGQVGANPRPELVPVTVQRVDVHANSRMIVARHDS